MPWIEAVLRGQKVLARVQTDGTLATEGGRVEIRYKPTDGRAYRAAAANLAVVEGAPLLPDDTCVPAEPVAQPSGDDARAAKKKDGASFRAKVAEWVAFTDGACSGNPGPAGAGMVVIAPGGKISEGYEFIGLRSTNNVAELTAILRAIEAIPADAKSVAIHTDSQYSIGVLTKGWKAKVNRELIAKARAVLASRKGVHLVYVPGHSGVPMNERADELAREAIKVRASKAL